MILVDDAGGLLPAINHSPWNGATLADFVMPFFLFIVGVSLGLTYKVYLLIMYNFLVCLISFGAYVVAPLSFAISFKYI